MYVNCVTTVTIKSGDGALQYKTGTYANMHVACYFIACYFIGICF